MKAKYEQIHTITGIRAIASLWVVLVHICYGVHTNYLPGFEGKVQWGLINNLIQHGALAVDVFFIISGFIIAYVYGDRIRHHPNRRTIIEYYLLRLARIYPLHLTVVLVLTVWYLIGFWDSKPIGLTDILLSLSLTNIISYPSVNSPAWSVSAEWLAYLLFPLIWWGVRFVTTKFLQIGFIICLTGCYLWSVNTYWSNVDWLYGYAAALRVLTGFTIGCLLYQLYQQPDRSKPADDTLYFIFFFGGMICLGLIKAPFYVVYAFIPFAIFYAIKSPPIARWLFSNRIMRYLGTISYAIYMVHYPVLELYRIGLNQYYATLDPVKDQLLINAYVMLMVVSVIAVASIAYHTIESPSRIWLKKQIELRRKSSH